MKKIAFLFKSGRRLRLQSEVACPSEFFYGYRQISATRNGISLIEDDDLGYGQRASLPWRIISIVFLWITGVHAFVVYNLLSSRVREQLNSYDAVVAMTASSGYALALLRTFRLLRPDVYFIVMGAIDPRHNFVRRNLQEYLLSKVIVLTISKGELVFLRDCLPNHKQVHYLPFGVDNEFWKPAQDDPRPEVPYVLTIGNDPNRDFETLISAWKPTYPHLKIVTRLPVHAGQSNIEIIVGDWSNRVLSDSEVRDLYRDALFVVLPIKETIQPSGQSACLQAMACGKAVVLSEVQGLWDNDIMIDSVSCFLVTPGSTQALQSKIEALLNNKGLLNLVGNHARNVVDSKLNTNIMAGKLDNYLYSIHSSDCA